MKVAGKQNPIISDWLASTTRQYPGPPAQLFHLAHSFCMRMPSNDQNSKSVFPALRHSYVRQDCHSISSPQRWTGSSMGCPSWEIPTSLHQPPAGRLWGWLPQRPKEFVAGRDSAALVMENLRNTGGFRGWSAM